MICLRFFLLCGLLAAWLLVPEPAGAQSLVNEKPAPGYFVLHGPGQPATIVYDSTDFEVIATTARHLAADLQQICGQAPRLSTSRNNKGLLVVIGSAERSSLIRDLVKRKKISLSAIAGKWEAYQLQVVDNPFPGCEKALVITGNDRRGPAFGAFEFSRLCGVSPWYWWADVPTVRKAAIYIRDNAQLADFPRVRYRGIFLNDEAPALANWTKMTFGGFRHGLYERVFELMLRLKANYIWPAMWGNAFYDDDPANIRTAERYAIVTGTSHHEPLMRAHDEWRRYGKGPWNYEKNPASLQEFWRRGMERATNEKIVSIGMRGDGDEPMTRETATALLEKIVQDQRNIIRQTTGQPPEKTPQLWALYKEVQDYYDKGMRVPDDVTLLLCDDNWGNIRRLPSLADSGRKGGYGIYYHFDYVGAPRNYKWINTNNITRTWEQMHLAWEYHARQIWIVNVGDLKPMEFPISFFLDYAWNPPAIQASNLGAYTIFWAAAQFGKDEAVPIGNVLLQFSRLNAHPKPELLDSITYSLHAYNEAERVVNEWRALREAARQIEKRIGDSARDAYYQLVLHPLEARTNLQELYYAVARNYDAYSKNDLFANVMADSARFYYQRDSLITLSYHRLRNGKWNHFMDQTHIGYTYWQQPETNSLPKLYTLQNGIATTIQRPSTNTRTATIPSGENEPARYRFLEKNGSVSMLAAHYSRAHQGRNTDWLLLPGIGKEGDGITTTPVTLSPATDSTWLEYDCYTYDSGQVSIHCYFSPTLDLFAAGGLRYAVRIGDGPEQTAVFNPHPATEDVWGKWVAQNIIVHSSSHFLPGPGRHTIRYRALDPGILLQKIVLQKGDAVQTLLGPPETADPFTIPTSSKN